MLKMTRFKKKSITMDQNLKKKIDLNSATSGVGLAEASKQLKMASAELFVVQMMGSRGESMNPMTFGNMTHPYINAMKVMPSIFRL